MQFRSRFFGFLFILSLLWICGGSALMSNAVQRTVDQNPNATDTTEATAFNAGAGIGGGLGITFFACTGLPLAAFFGLMAWRNSVGLRNDKRHKEQLDALRGKAE